MPRDELDYDADFCYLESGMPAEEHKGSITDSQDSPVLASGKKKKGKRRKKL